MGVRVEKVVSALERASWWREIPELYGRTWRWSETVDTPRAILEVGTWRDETHDRRVWITKVGRKLLLRVDSCPWVSCRDVDVTNTRAMKIAREPQEAFA